MEELCCGAQQEFETENEKTGLPEPVDAEFCRFPVHQNVIFNSNMLKLFSDIRMFCL